MGLRIVLQKTAVAEDVRKYDIPKRIHLSLLLRIRNNIESTACRHPHMTKRCNIVETKYFAGTTKTQTNNKKGTANESTQH